MLFGSEYAQTLDPLKKKKELKLKFGFCSAYGLGWVGGQVLA